MPVRIICVCFLFGVFSVFGTTGHTAFAKEPIGTGGHAICGRWESVEKTLIIRVYMEGDAYKAKIEWFSDTGGKPMDYWTDRRNPNPALRSRKILGLDILHGLEYNPATNSWENGMVYDSKHGREWNASAYIDNSGLLRVRGYWHFKFIGRTMDFRRPD